MSFGLAKFLFVRDLASFDFAGQPLIDKEPIRDSTSGRFIANGKALLLLGPPGVTRPICPSPSAARRSSRPTRCTSPARWR